MRLAVLALLALPVVLLQAGPAEAHAALRSSEPVSGAELATRPQAVTLTFESGVVAQDSAVEVFDDRLQRVDDGRTTALPPGRSRLTTALRAPAAGRPGTGTYTVRWHATSTDTHPVSGTFRFSVGAPSVVRGAPPGEARNDAAGLLLGPLRWAGYAGLVLGPGLLLVALWLCPEALRQPSVRRLAVAGCVLLAVGTLCGMVVQGVWASGVPFSALWRSPQDLSTRSRRFDQVYALRSYLLVLFAACAAYAASRAGRADGRRLLLAGSTASAVALVGTWPLVGHSADGSGAGWAVLANLLHTAAMAVWLGGLVLLLVALRPATALPGRSLLLVRFSRLAQVSVGVLVLTGTVMAWREVRTLDALTSTEFGALLLAKLAGVAVLLALGDLSRRWVLAHAVPGGDAALAVAPTRLSRGVAAEVVVAAAVLAVTAALVVVVPASQAERGPGVSASTSRP